ncbi:MAG: ROK family protein [bacterium]
MKSKKTIGIDIGGTKIYAGLVCEGRIIKSKKEKTPNSRQKVITLLGDLIEQLAEGEGAAGVGIGCAGFIDVEKGEVISSPNLPGWENVPLKRIIEERTSLPVFIDNDVNCAALAEFKLGAGQGKKNLVGIFVGTGIGGGIILNGQLIHGAAYSGAELGHITLKPNGPKCNCGRLGCLEAFAGGSSIINFTHRKVSAVHEITKAANEGKKWAILAIERAGKYLSLGIANLITILSPELVVLGGGVIKAAPRIVEIVKEQVPLMTLPMAMKGVEIKVTKLQDEAGLLGAALGVDECGMRNAD